MSGAVGGTLHTLDTVVNPVLPTRTLKCRQFQAAVFKVGFPDHHPQHHRELARNAAAQLHPDQGVRAWVGGSRLGFDRPPR